MTIYRGPGGAGDATNDAIVNAVAAYATSAASSADNAANSASAASTSATNASTSATNASSSASQAATSASNSAASASTASTQASTATTQASNAAASATAASSSAASASTYASNAASSASTATSKAAEAETYAIRAETAETNAETAYSNTLGIFGDATDVANAVAAASTSATNAANSAAAAASSATAASGSATTAGNYASAALNSANTANAEASEAQAAANTAVAALQSAQAIYGGLDDVTAAVNEAEDWATQSANSATASANSATQATTNGAVQVALATAQATNASNSANAAATSATNAANSATQSAASAASAAAIVTGVASNRASIHPSLLLDFANTKQLDPRITYSRASTGTYYDGKTVAKAEENLFTRSQEFDNAAWVKTNSTITANATTAPDGTTTADKLIQTTDTGAHRTNPVITLAASTVYTFSVYAKAGELSWMAINISDSVNDYVYYDLTNGVLGTVDPQTTATITSVGSGWYRCTYTKTSSGGLSRADIYVTTGNNVISFTGSDNTSGIYLWGAQLEQRSTVTAYTPTTTSPITNYIPALQTAAAGVPRFDHDPITGESKGFLIEEQRTNLLTYSEQFDNANWIKSNASITTNAVVSPNGMLTGDKIVENTSNAAHVAYQAASITSGTIYTFTAYAKSGERTGIFIGIGGVANAEAYFNLATGAVISTGAALASASIVAVGNGWYRCAIVHAATASASRNFQVLPLNGSNATTYTGDGYSGIYIWGAQLEAGSFATSYIPTVASQVTRSADAASMTGANFSSWYRADEGSFYSEFNIPATTAHVITSGAGRFMYVVTTGATSGAARIYDGTNTSATSASFLLGTNVKAATSFSASGMAATSNGTAVVTSAYDGSISDGVLYIGSNANNATERANGTIKRIAYYPKRLQNSELQGLTS